MSAILNSLNAHNFPIFQPILMKLVSKFMVYRALSDKTYLLSGLLSPLSIHTFIPVQTTWIITEFALSFRYVLMINIISQCKHLYITKTNIIERIPDIFLFV